MWQLIKTEFSYYNWLIAPLLAINAILCFVAPHIITIPFEKGWRLGFIFISVGFVIAGHFERSVKDRLDQYRMRLPLAPKMIAQARILYFVLVLIGGITFYLFAQLLNPLLDPGFRELVYLGFVGLSFIAFMLIIHDLRQIFPKLSSPWGDMLWFTILFLHTLVMPWIWKSTLLPFVVSPSGFLISILYSSICVAASLFLFANRLSYLR